MRKGAYLRIPVNRTYQHSSDRGALRCCWYDDSIHVWLRSSSKYRSSLPNVESLCLDNSISLHCCALSSDDNFENLQNDFIQMLSVLFQEVI